MFENAVNVNRHLGGNGRFSKCRLTRYGMTRFLRSLRNHSTSEQHICFLKVCMLTNAPTLLTVVKSDEFEIARGTEQGYLFSSSLFNSVLQSAMEKDIGIWKEKELWQQIGRRKQGLHVKLETCWRRLFCWQALSTNSKKSKRCTEAQGPEIQPDKTKVLTSQESDTRKEVDIDEIQVAIFPSSWRKKPSIWDRWFH